MGDFKMRVRGQRTSSNLIIRQQKMKPHKLESKISEKDTYICLLPYKKPHFRRVNQIFPFVLICNLLLPQNFLHPISNRGSDSQAPVESQINLFDPMQKGEQSASMPLQISTDPRIKIEKNIPGSNRATTDPYPPEYKLEKSSSYSKKIDSDEAAVITHQFLLPESALPSSPKIRSSSIAPDCSGRERLKRHRVEVAGRVWIPDVWGHEGLLKDWTDCTAFDSNMVNSSIMSARAALIEEARRANSTRFRIENSC